MKSEKVATLNEWMTGVRMLCKIYCFQDISSWSSSETNFKSNKKKRSSFCKSLVTEELRLIKNNDANF